MSSEPEHAESREKMYGNDPGLAATESGAPDGIDKGAPEELERVGVGGEGEDANLAVGHVVFEEKGHGAHGEAHGDALKKVEQDEEHKVALVLEGQLEEAGIARGRSSGDGVVERKRLAGHVV